MEKKKYVGPEIKVHKLCFSALLAETNIGTSQEKANPGSQLSKQSDNNMFYSFDDDEEN